MNENTYANSAEEEEEEEPEELEELEEEEEEVEEPEEEEEVMVKQLVRHSRKFINVNTRYNIHLLLPLFRKSSICKSLICKSPICK